MSSDHSAPPPKGSLRQSNSGLMWPDAEWKKRFRRQLMKWFRENARDLPWRRTRDLYRIWVSEVMLQQTQVATVIPYYEAFLEAFPTLADLAAADEHQVLRQWEGLGYYRRARQLHQAARQIVAHHQGKVPEQVGPLRELPGIGRYTAGAILSIGKDQQLPILEANTVRLYSRLLGYLDDPRSTQGQRTLWEFAEKLVPRREAGRFNQALMELGSEVCTPKQPNCAECPVQGLCPTHHHQWQERIPLAPKRVVYEAIREVAVVIWRGEKILLRQCQDGERWAGLWDVPRFPLCSESPVLLAEQLMEETRRLTGINVRPGAKLLSLKYGVTRYRITLDCYLADYIEEKNSTTRNASEGPPILMAWVMPMDCATYPLSVTGRKLIGHLTPAPESDFTS